MPTAASEAADNFAGCAVERWGVGRRDLLLVAAVTAGAFLLRAAQLNARSLWFDETFSVAVARLPWREVLRVVGQSDAHPPLYYLLLHLWMGVGSSPAAVRALSALFGTLAVAVTYLLGLAMAGRLLGVTAAVLMAGSAFAVQASVEARMGALLTLLAVGSTFWLVRAAMAPSRRWSWIAYGATLAAALYAHYFAFLLLPAHLLYVLVAADRSVRRPFLLTLGAVAVAYAPWWPVAADQFLDGRARAVWIGPMPLWAPLNIVALSSFGGYVLGLGGFLFGPTAWSWPQALAVLPFLALALAGALHLGRRAGLLMLAGWLLPVAILIAVSLLSGIFYAVPRQLAFLQPFFALLLAAGILSLAARRRSAIPFVALTAAIVAVNLSVLSAAAADPRTQPFDWARAAQYVEARWRPGDRLVFYPHTARVAFAYYFSVPGAEAVTLYPPAWPARSAAGVPPPALPDLLSGADRFWLVLTGPAPPGSTEALLAAADRAYRRRQVIDFRRVYVLLYVRR